jgi:formate dehydrogenase subunit gamma
MAEGTVDLNWAREHHSLWLEEESGHIGPGNLERQPSATPAE